ncbi:MAG: pentapeptide repeat-containing protein [Anaerolineae bacterium]|nr:pentapeptide repeat-containing protein [Anaerolineae bacterium]
MHTRLTNLSNRAVLLILFILFAGGSLWSLVINLTSPNANFAEWGESWLQNFSTEMFGAFLTFMLLTLVLGTRQEKERLIRQLRSQVNEAALQAAEELAARGWLADGSLKGANLRRANLQGAGLEYANLQGASLRGTNLQGTNLTWANLQGASLKRANLQGANLTWANLQGASLWDANLQGASLGAASFDEKTILPDRKLARLDHNNNPIYTPESYYQPSVTDMTRYTDPNHPDFWQPEWVKRRRASDSAGQ